MLTPVLLVVLAVLFAKAFLSPLGTILPPTGNYIDAPFTQGFQDGYQTMDLLASVAIGTLVVNAVRMRGGVTKCGHRPHLLITRYHHRFR